LGISYYPQFFRKTTAFLARSGQVWFKAGGKNCYKFKKEIFGSKRGTEELKYLTLYTCLSDFVCVCVYRRHREPGESESLEVWSFSWGRRYI
jgi:hypothetical protein